ALISCLSIFSMDVAFAGEITMRQARVDLEARLGRTDAANSNTALLDILKDYDKEEFEQEEEYLRFVNSIQDLFIEDQEGYLELLFYVGEILQEHKHFLDAYPYLYKISLKIEQEGVKPGFICTYYEVMGHSYYFFGRYRQAEEMFDKGLSCEGVT